MARAASPEATLRGRIAYVFDDYFDVDYIVGPSRMHDSQANEIDYLRKWVMHDYDPHFASKVHEGDMLVAGHLFGYGHPHGQGMRVMRDLGIKVVIAESFFPSFHQNESFHGMILLTCPGIGGAVGRWDEVEVSWREARVFIPARSTVLGVEPLTPHEITCIEAGGEIAALQRCGS